MMNLHKTEMVEPFNIGLSVLSEFQTKILEECLDRGSAGLSLPMGTGKTLLAILIGLHQREEAKSKFPVLVVVAKNLLASWIYEIKKFFGDELPYLVLHGPSVKSFAIDHKCLLVLTTPEVIAKSFKENAIEGNLIVYEAVTPMVTIKNYVRPVKPFLNHPIGSGLLYSIKWPCFIVDEAQKYTKITTQRSQGLAAICARRRWVLSGTLFDEPTTERILGYHLILDLPGTPRSLPDMETFIRSPEFRGLRRTCVYREKNENFREPNVKRTIISHDLSIPEAKLYCSLRETLTTIRRQAREMQLIGDKENAKRFSSYLLAMITYLRQSLVCPMVPIASVALDMADYKNKSELSKILMKQIETMELSEWLSDVDSVKSSRISRALQTIHKHRKERVVLFTCFRSCLEIVQRFLPQDRDIYVIKPSDKIAKRGEIVDEFSESKNGILLLTYELGAEGLNLQAASTVLILDFWWNSGKTDQAVARVLRFGQMADNVHVYFYTSNTGIEKALFEKQKAKQTILHELQTGSSQTKVPTMSMREIIKLIEQTDNRELLHGILG